MERVLWFHEAGDGCDRTHDAIDVQDVAPSEHAGELLRRRKHALVKHYGRPRENLGERRTETHDQRAKTDAEYSRFVLKWHFWQLLLVSGKS